ncbi:MAG: DUF2071 domain-containing protein [Polyangiaceae bacterium]|nr:DUF2071 domain-containing protein [Polyangiaceae bacterium]
MPAIDVRHRPWPLPQGPWIGRQSWCDLLFAHWPIAASVLRPLVPKALEIQEFAGTSWVGLVPFRMQGVMLRGLPDVPGISAFPELNVRLYVEHKGKPGVWFLSLDASSKLAVWGARKFFHLPYFHADMSLTREGERISYRSVRKANVAYQETRSAESAPLLSMTHAPTFVGDYTPTSSVYSSKPGSLEHWLTERYCLYAEAPDGSLRCTDVHHAPWPLQKAELQLTRNSMFEGHGISLPGTPELLHFSRRIDVIFWPPSPAR